VVADPKIEQIADGVYEIVEMPEVEIEALTEDGNHSAESLEEAWWCVEIDGEKVRVMNTHGKLAAGIARVLWADNADLAQATLVGIDLGDGQVIVIGPDTELFLDIVWS
jgi:hypothetical protein